MNNASGSAPGHPEIFYGSGITQSSFLFPTATVAAWEKFIQTATASVSSQSAADGNNVLIGTFIVIVLSLVLTLL